MNYCYAINELMLNNKIGLAHHVDLITKPNAHKNNQLKHNETEIVSFDTKINQIHTIDSQVNGNESKGATVDRSFCIAFTHEHTIT